MLSGPVTSKMLAVQPLKAFLRQALWDFQVVSHEHHFNAAAHGWMPGKTFTGRLFTCIELPYWRKGRVDTCITNLLPSHLQKIEYTIHESYDFTSLRDCCTRLVVAPLEDVVVDFSSEDDPDDKITIGYYIEILSTLQREELTSDSEDEESDFCVYGSPSS
jgi:hypothetical protein